MSLFVIADLHLSTLDSTNKSMEVFGPKWANYTQRLEVAWKSIVTEKDTVIVPGDISWALTLEEAESDLRFLDQLPGKKILLKGNHDFWWTTMSKLQRFLDEKNLHTLLFLHNNAYVINDYVICGSRGWYHDSDIDGAKQANASYEKIVLRECVRLSLSLKEAVKLIEQSETSLTPVCFLHFPPHWSEKTCQPILDVLKEYDVKYCYFGHIHGAEPTSFEKDDIHFTLVAADALGFTPKLISQQ